MQRYEMDFIMSSPYFIHSTMVSPHFSHLSVPYGVALREFIRSKDLFTKNKRIVFLDYIGNEVLLTIFNNGLFTTPRRLSVAVSRVVTELTRSEENYKTINKLANEVKTFI